MHILRQKDPRQIQILHLLRQDPAGRKKQRQQRAKRGRPSPALFCHRAALRTGSSFSFKAVKHMSSHRTQLPSVIFPCIPCEPIIQSVKAYCQEGPQCSAETAAKACPIPLNSVLSAEPEFLPLRPLPAYSRGQALPMR